MLPLVMYATSIVVLVLDELAEDAAHRDDVVVRVRREADRALPLGSLLLPRIFAPSALNTSPFSAPGDPERATSDDMPCSA